MSKKLQRYHRVTLLAAGCSVFGFSQQVNASGFAVPETSIAGLAMSNALVANPVEPGAFSYNPAAMGFHEHSSISAGALAIVPTLSVETDSGNHNSDGKDIVGIPLFQGALKLGKDWTVGLGVAAPFGLETDWEQGTFPGFAGPLAAVAPTHSKLELLAFTPTVTYRINEKLSVSGGIDYYDARDVKLNSALVEIEGDNQDTGWNLGLMFRHGDWSFGLNYHSDVTINVKGHFKASPPAGSGAKIPAEANLDLPWRLQIGARWQATEKLAVEFDVSRTGWSEFEEIKVTADGTFGPIPGGAELTTSTNDWDDANAYRLGASYQLLPNTQLRFGYTYDKTPQDDDNFSARIPDNDRHLFSLGLGLGLKDGWGIEAGYMFVHFENRNVSSNTPFRGGDPNGTSAYNGKYDSHVHLFGLSINKTFM